MIVSLNNVSFVYSDRDYETSVLSGCSLEVKQGDKIVIWGVSGSGKSTLLSLIGSRLRPTKGSITLSHNIRGEIAWVDQQQFLIDSLSVRENVELVYLGRGNDPNDPTFKKRYAEVMEGLGILKYEGKCPSVLSRGERQRVCIARAILSNSELIILDEPTAALDVKNKEHVIDMLVSFLNRKTLVVATHDEIFKKYSFLHYTLSDLKLVKQEIT